MLRTTSALPPSKPATQPGPLASVHLDLPLLTALVLLCGFGLLVLYRATNQDWDQVQRQMMRLGLAFVVMLTLAQVIEGEVEDRIQRRANQERILHGFIRDAQLEAATQCDRLCRSSDDHGLPAVTGR